MSDQEVKETNKGETQEEREAAEKDGVHCVWNMGSPCGGERFKKLLFSKQLEIPICHNHLEEHKEVMILHANDYDIEEVLDMTAEERKRIVYTLVLSGLDIGKVEI